METIHVLCHKGLMDEEGRALIRTNISDLGVKVANIPPTLTLMFVTGCNHGDVGGSEWRLKTVLLDDIVFVTHISLSFKKVLNESHTTL